ncbi:hypothetical protein V8C34DRAFT_301469 [Trichoderma compactum]
MSSNACYSHELHRGLVRVSRELALLCRINGLHGFNGLNGFNGLKGFNGFNSFDGFDGFNVTLLMSSIGWKKDVNAEHALNRRIQTLKWAMRTLIDWYTLSLRRDYFVLSTQSFYGD